MSGGATTAASSAIASGAYRRSFLTWATVGPASCFATFFATAQYFAVLAVGLALPAPLLLELPQALTSSTTAAPAAPRATFLPRMCGLLSRAYPTPNVPTTPGPDAHPAVDASASCHRAWRRVSGETR